MKFGPFESFVIERLEKKLNKLSIPFKVSTDKEELEKQDQKFHEKSDALPFNPGFNYSGRAFYIEIDENNLKILGNKLENYGVVSSDYFKNSVHNDKVAEKTKRNDSSSTVNIGSFIVKFFFFATVITILYLLYNAIFKN